ncbi:TPA: hypothetical protein I7229_22815 [Vibrio vulnificus]|nr:hypothetical protein [Vibrio vulnificus]HDY7572160.1 hypothetical protein [Vibrio vulnificus]
MFYKILWNICSVLMILLLGIIAVQASQLKEVYTDHENCSIVEVGDGFKKDPLKFKGRRWQKAYSKLTGCAVEVTKTEFESVASYCFVSSVNISKAGSCRFGLQNNGDYIFEFEGEQGMGCRFICVKEN